MTVKFLVEDRVYNVLDEQAEKYGGCHMTWMNREVMDKHDAHPFAWQDAPKDMSYDYYAVSGNFWD